MEDEQYIDVLSFWDNFKKHFLTIFIVMTLSIIGAVAFTYLPSPKYEATVKLLFPEGGMAGIASMAASLGLSSGMQNPIETYDEILKSRPVIEKVARRTNLGFKDAQKAVKIKKYPDAAIIEIEARGKTAAEAAWIANSYRWALMDMDQKLKLSRVTPEVSFVQEQLKKVKADLEKSSMERRQFQEKNKILMPADTTGRSLSLGGSAGNLSAIAGVPSLAAPTVSGNIYAFDDQLRAVDIQLQDVGTRIQEYKSRQEQISQNAMELPADSPLAQNWRERFYQKQYELAVAQHQYGDSHPTVVLLKKDIEEIKKRILNEVSRSRQAIEQGIETEMVNLEIERVALQSKRDALAKLVEEGPKLDQEANRLLQEVQFQSNLYATLRTQYAQFEMDRQRNPNRWEILEDAVPPEKPYNRRILRNLALAILIGTFLSFLVVWFIENLMQAYDHRKAGSRSKRTGLTA